MASPGNTVISGEQVLYPERFHDIDELVESCWDQVRRNLAQRGYGAEEVKIHMALAETLINAWEHGNRRRSELPILLRWHLNDNFTFEVQDSGEDFDFQALPNPTAGERLTAENGRGIFFIKTFARSVSWRDRGRHIIVTFAQPE